MILGGTGGENTKTGLVFEKKTDLSELLNSQNGYKVENGNVYFDNKLIARIFKKHEFYKFLEDKLEIKWKDLISKQLLPDDSILISNIFYILEYKFQQVAGSVDEKLQTCDFKKNQYQKLLDSKNIKVEYIYVLGSWFEKSKYKDDLDYIHKVGCFYFFEPIPLLAKLGLQVPE